MQLPFGQGDAPLSDILRDQYIAPLCNWLVRPGADQLLTQITGSAWETALTLDFLRAVRRDGGMAASDDPVASQEAAKKSANACVWLLERRIEEHREPNTSGSALVTCWEHVSWDSAVIAAALFREASDPDALLDDETRALIFKVTVSVMDWFEETFQSWEALGKYSFGSADVAAVLKFYLAIAEAPAAVRRKLGRARSKANEAMISDLVDHLLFAAAHPPSAHHSGAASAEAKPCWWSDFHTSADVVEALAAYYALFGETAGASRDAADDRARSRLGDTREILAGYVSHIGLVQADGMWGSHLDTIRTLNAYIVVCDLARSKTPSFGLQAPPQIVFKALRFICDEKQFFSSGSYQHTSYLTVFAAEALVSTYLRWAPARQPVARIYDDVIWASPARTDEAFSQRAMLQVALANAETELAVAAQNAADLRHEARATRRTARKTVVKAALGLASAVVVLVALYASGVIAFTLDFDGKADTVSVILALGGISYAILYAIVEAVTARDDRE